mgnify:CR=1 FL=1
MLALATISFCALPVWGNPGNAPSSDSQSKDEDRLIVAEYREVRRTTRPDDDPISSSNAIVNVIQAGDSSRSAAEKCIAALPLQRMKVEHRRAAEAILNEYSLFRQMPTLELAVHHETYRFFASHPDVAVSIWRAMEISKFQMWQTGPTEYEADTGDGSVGAIEVLWHDPSEIVILCRGVYGSPLLIKPIAAKALIHLHTEYAQDDDGTPKIVHKASLFATFPSNAVETAAKLISPISNMVIDRNFREISVFLHMMWLAMSRQPGWVEHMAGQLDGVLEIRKEQLLTCTAKVFVAERRRKEQGPLQVRAQSPGQSRETKANAADPSKPSLSRTTPPAAPPVMMK